MPFSFKPTEGQEGVPVQAVSSPVVALNSATPDLMSRDDGTRSSLLHTLLLGVFDILVVVTIVLFGYKWYLSSQVDAKKAQLAAYESQLGSLPFDDMRKVSNRLKLITQLIQTHPSVNVAFRILEESVENSVTYTRFDLHYADAGRGYELALNALATNYHAVIQQMDTLKSKPYSTYISNPVISNLHPDPTGYIGFNVTMPIIIAGLLPETLMLNTSTATSTPVTNMQMNATSTVSGNLMLQNGTTTVATSTIKQTNATSTASSTVGKTTGTTTPTLPKK